MSQTEQPAIEDEPELEPRRRGRPRGSTRERILDVALALFNEQGYDSASLRDIAERLGMTKAALYYHFERKEDILLELHLRLHAIGNETLEQLANLSEAKQAEAWPAIFDRFIDQIFENSDLFLLHVRNANALKVLANNERHQAENEDVEERMRQLLSSREIPVAKRVRIAASIGAVTAVIASAAGFFDDVPPADLADDVRSIVHDILGTDDA